MELSGLKLFHQLSFQYFSSNPEIRPSPCLFHNSSHNEIKSLLLAIPVILCRFLIFLNCLSTVLIFFIVHQTLDQLFKKILILFHLSILQIQSFCFYQTDLLKFWQMLGQPFHLVLGVQIFLQPTHQQHLHYHCHLH